MNKETNETVQPHTVVAAFSYIFFYILNIVCSDEHMPTHGSLRTIFLEVLKNT